MKASDELDLLFLARENLKDREAQFLHKQGWGRTCDTPGSLWLWETKYKDKTILVSQSTALEMESSFLSGVYSRG